MVQAAVILGWHVGGELPVSMWLAGIGQASQVSPGWNCSKMEGSLAQESLDWRWLVRTG